MSDKRCDVCGGAGCATRISSSQMRDAVERGFHLYVAGIVMPPRFASLLPAVREQLLARWNLRVAQDVSDWDLCSHCYPTVQQYLREIPAPLGISEAWATAPTVDSERTVLEKLIDRGVFRDAAATEPIGYYDPGMAPFRVFAEMRIAIVQQAEELVQKLSVPSPSDIMAPFDQALGDERVRTLLNTTTVGPFFQRYTYCADAPVKEDEGASVVLELQLNTLANLLLTHPAFADTSSPTEFTRAATMLAVEQLRAAPRGLRSMRTSEQTRDVHDAAVNGRMDEVGVLLRESVPVDASNDRYTDREDCVAKEWSVRCPNCGATFEQSEAQLAAAHLSATLNLMRGGGPGAREALENYTIECPRCSKTMPFEPRSEFRRRKAAAVQQRLDAIAALAPADEAGREVVKLALAGGQLTHSCLEMDFPLDNLRANIAKLRPTWEVELRSRGLDVKRHPAARLLDEIFDIAGADIGERSDLPQAARDDVSDKRDALLESLKALNREQSEPGAPKAQSAVRKSGGWIAAITIVAVIGIGAAIVKFSGHVSPEHPDAGPHRTPEQPPPPPPPPPSEPTSLCGSSDASPPSTLDRSQWARYRCRLRDSSDCLPRSAYTTAGRGCPGDELCCPP
jgi:endogenous inhibitor of DNA gyrase (YacG/DUF329 family)